MDQSPLFRTFVVKYRDKIRAKVRGCRAEDDSIESRRDSIKAAILERIALADSELQFGESRGYTIPGAERLIEIEISKPPGKARRNRTSYYGGTFPVWYTQREFTKFGDIVCGKLGQFGAGTPGILAVGSRNMTHEDIDCENALSELSRLARKRDDAFFQKKGFAGTADFLSQYRGLSGISYRSSWIGDGPRNFVWTNPDAGNPVNREIIAYLEDMD